MNEYTLKFNTDIDKEENNEINSLPLVPFIIEVIDGAIGEKYLIVKDNEGLYFKLIGLNQGDNFGKLLDANWSKHEIIRAINDNIWILHKSEIKLIK
jgi:hypothetical protein